MRPISASTWAEIRTAYASGIGLREIARNMGIPAGTVLARSKREGWTQQIAQAKLIERPELARDLATIFSKRGSPRSGSHLRHKRQVRGRGHLSGGNCIRS